MESLCWKWVGESGSQAPGFLPHTLLLASEHLTQALWSSAPQAFPQPDHKERDTVYLESEVSGECCPRLEVKAQPPQRLSRPVLCAVCPGKLCWGARLENHCPWVALTKPGYFKTLRLKGVEAFSHSFNLYYIRNNGIEFILECSK